jgi:hypothetical protein
MARSVLGDLKRSRGGLLIRNCSLLRSYVFGLAPQKVPTLPPRTLGATCDDGENYHRACLSTAATPEPCDLVCRVTSGDRGVGPLGGPQSPGKTTLRAAFMVAVNGGRPSARLRQGFGDGLVGRAVHDGRVRRLVEVAASGPPGPGASRSRTASIRCALVGEKAVQRVHEHPRNQLRQDQSSSVSIRSEHRATFAYLQARS